MPFGCRGDVVALALQELRHGQSTLPSPRSYPDAENVTKEFVEECQIVLDATLACAMANLTTARREERVDEMRRSNILTNGKACHALKHHQARLGAKALLKRACTGIRCGCIHRSFRLDVRGNLV